MMLRWVAALWFIVLSVNADALEVPDLKSHINDYAGMLSSETIRRLEADLVNLEKSDSTQVVVLTIPSLKGEVLEEFSIKVAEKWKIGQKKTDNGVILLIAKEDRKLRIEVGRGLEGKLTDLISGRILRDEIKPKFKAGDFQGGVVSGVAAIISTVKGEYKATSATGKKADKPPTLWSALGIFTFFGFIFLFIAVIMRKWRRGSFRSGGYGGSDNSYSGSNSDSSSGSSDDSYSGGGGSFGGGGSSDDW
jgi:uncharacterized protein